MDLHLDKLAPSDSVRIYISGRLVGEVAVSRLNGIEDLQTEVEKARYLRALPKIVKGCVASLIDGESLWGEGLTKESCRVEFSKGLKDGYEGNRTPYPLEGVPPYLPGHTPAYRLGYSHGEALARVLKHLDELERVK